MFYTRPVCKPLVYFKLLIFPISAINIYEFYISWSGTLRGVGTGRPRPPSFEMTQQSVIFSFVKKRPFVKLKRLWAKKHLILKENLNSALLLADISHINWDL